MGAGSGRGAAGSSGFIRCAAGRLRANDHAAGQTHRADANRARITQPKLSGHKAPGSQDHAPARLIKLAVIRPGRAVVLAHAQRHTSNVFCNASEFKKKAKCARSSESLPTGLLCNQYNPECDGKSAIRIRAKFRGYLKHETKNALANRRPGATKKFCANAPSSKS
jgi:hypothetical protein